jgi:ANTAR domain/PAS fold
MSTPAPTRVRTRVGTSSATPTAPCARPPAAEASPAGRYRLDPRSTDWWWSPEMYQLLDLPPEGTHPCTELMLQLQHREDRARTLAALTGACTEGRPFAVETRMLRRDGTLRVMLLVGEPLTDGHGGVSSVEGLCVDVTAGRLAHDDDLVTALQTEVTQLRTAMASRATIEQAKGILMLLTSCSDQVAFDLLAHISSHTHRKVRDVAQVITESAAGQNRLPDDIRSIIRDACPPAQPLR